MTTKKTQLNYLQMLKEIDSFLESDWAADMECKLIPDSKPYTQKEAEEMAEILGRIYSISHCIHCKACQGKYKLK